MNSHSFPLDMAIQVSKPDIQAECSFCLPPLRSSHPWSCNSCELPITASWISTAESSLLAAAQPGFISATPMQT